MSATIIDGKAYAAKLRERVAAEVARLKAEHGIVPGLATVLVGNDPASEIYIRNKGKSAAALGLHSLHRTMPADTPEAEVLAHVRALNVDKSVHGILIQMPLPPQVREAAVLDTLDPGKVRKNPPQGANSTVNHGTTTNLRPTPTDADATEAERGMPVTPDR